ncbi:MAG TPA: arsenate reductase family protein [Limnochordales bacterium]
MAKVTLYHYPSCTSCRKARQLLDELGAEVTERRYFTDKPTEAEIRELAKLMPGGVQDLISRRSRRFKELGLADRELSDDEWIALLAKEPGLWRRPITVRGQRVVVGWDEEALRNLLA